MELRQKVERLEKKHREALDEAEFNGAHEEYIMNRIASKPAFMTNDAIAEAARIFAEERERKEKLKNDALNSANMNQDANSGKLKPILVITKGKLGQKTKKRDVDDDAVRGKDKLQARDIKGMEELHWRVVQTRREMDELKAAIETPNIFDILYEPFELHTVKRKRAQIELLREVVFELKRDFNEEFKRLEKQKEEHIFMIKEKNEVIKDLLESLGQPIELDEPTAHILENPEHILEISPDEVKVEKYLTKEQRALLEEEERKRAEREALLRGDNLGQRGLKHMMGGNELIMKKEKNKLEEELVREDWMNTKKEEDMTEDEKQRFKEQLQKEKDLIEKQRKQWQINLRRVQAEIVEVQLKFEEQLLSLYKKRLFYDARIYEQELYIVRLIIMLHDIRETKENNGKFTDEYHEIE